MAINPISNALEDGIDDYVSTVVFKNLTDYFKPMQDSLAKGDDDSAFNDALSSSLSTLQAGISIMAISYITNTFLPVLRNRAIAYFTYSVLGSATKSIIKGSLFSLLRGKAKRGLLGTVVANTSERNQRLHTANNFVSHLDNVQLKKEQMGNDFMSRTNSSLLSSSSELGNKSIVLYTQKTKMGVWTSSQDDYKIYKRATGRKLPTGITWSKFHKELNQFKEFALDSEQNVINLAKVQFDTFLKEGYTNVH